MTAIAKIPEPESRSYFRRYSPFWQSLIGLIIALLTTLFFFSPVVMPVLTNPIVAAGLDPLPTALISALCLTTCAALVSALINRQRWTTTIAAGIIYIICYILPFFQQELLPQYDPAGHLETLNMGVLLHNIFILLAAGLLCAFLGAAMGKAVHEVLLDPLWQLARQLWYMRFSSEQANHQQVMVERARLRSSWSIFATWSGFFALLAIIIVSSSVQNLLFFSPDVGVHTSAVGTIHGTLIADSMISPALHGQRRSFLVYLPPSYQDEAMQGKHFPTLYLLHGSPGSEYDWIEGGKAVESADTLINYQQIPFLIMVFPDGNGRAGETSEWGNSADQQQMMENYVALDLVHFIDQKYRTIPSPRDRAIGGFSMGAFGAMNIAVHHPDIFGSVISLAGYYAASGGIWGQNTAYIEANSPAFVLPRRPQAWKLRIFLGAATGDQPYYADTQQFMSELKTLHIGYTFDLEHGHHDWSIWETQLYHALLWLQY